MVKGGAQIKGKLYEIKTIPRVILAYKNNNKKIEVVGEWKAERLSTKA